MKKYIWCMTLGFMVVAMAAEAKRAFYVEKEVRCGVGDMCYEVASGLPLNGPLRRYYPDGVVRENVHYVNGVKDGVAQKFFPDGKQQAYMVYQNGVLEGGSSTYYNSGNMEYETNYTAGVMNGARTGYYEDGTLMFEGEYADGVKNGRERRYYADGKLKSEIVFEGGKPISASCRTVDGQRIDFTADVRAYLPIGRTPCGAY